MQHEILLRQIDEDTLRTIIREEIARVALTMAPTPPAHTGRPDMLTLREARNVLRISQATLQRRIREKSLATVRIGRRRLVSSEEIKRILGETDSIPLSKTARRIR